MNITILTIGSRGDAEPCGALALKLAARGHDVRLIAPRAFSGLVEGDRIEFVGLEIDVHAQARSRETAALFDNSASLAAYPLWLKAMFAKIADEAFAKALEGARGADVVVGASLGEPFAALAARHVGVPCVHSWNFPVIPSRDFLCSLSPPPPFALPGWLNAKLFALGDSLVWGLARRWMAQAGARFDLGAPGRLSPLRQAVASGETVLFPYSPALLPPSRDWPDNVLVTGYWRAGGATAWRPPEALAAFLAAGPAPVYIGFGSMQIRDRQAALALLRRAIRRAGRRAIVAAGWSGLELDEASDDIAFIAEAQHEWLFPRVAAVAHHGGAGTTGAALAAGRPSVVTPFILDQFFWADIVFKRGLSPPPLRFARLTSDALAAAIRAATEDPRFKDNAARLAAAMAAEDGLAAAATAIEAAARRPASSSPPPAG